VAEVVYGSAREIRRGIADMIRPPQQTTVAESIARNLRIVNPSGAREYWNPSTAPYMVEPVNLVRSRRYEGLIFMGPARSGKTIALGDGVLAYSIVDDPADCMVFEKSKDDAEDYSKTRMRRAIHGSPELAKRISARAHDDNVYLKTFRSGMNIRFGWPSLGQTSGKDIRRALILDADNATGDMALSETWGLVIKRTQTYMSSGFCVAESSPARDYDDPQWVAKHPHEAPPAEGIASLYNMGDRRMYYWPCPECKEPFCAAPGVGLFMLPAFDELVERTRVEDPRAISLRHECIWCPSCGVQIDQRWKHQMLLAGRWVGQGQKMHADGTVTGELLDVRVPSFWLGGVAAAYQSWGSLVERYVQAVGQYARTGEVKPLKTTCNVDQAVPFIPPSARARKDADQIVGRRTELQQGVVPHGARFLTAQVDVQAGKRRGFVLQVVAWGRDREHWIIDRYALKSSERLDADGKAYPIDPSGYVEDWNRLKEKAIERSYPLADGSGRVMRVRLTVCDSGGEDGVSNRAYEFHRRLVREGKDSRFRLLKGRDTGPRMLADQYPDTRGRKDRDSGSAGDVPVCLINVNELKDTLAADLERTVPGPGYWHIPRWMDDSQVRELTSEVRTSRGWRKASNSAPNESVDLCAYAEASYLRLQGERIDWDNPPAWAAEWDRNSEVSAGTGAPQPTMTRRPLIRSASKYLGG